MKFAQTNPILGAILYNFLFGISYLPLKILTARLNGDTALLIALRFAICLVLLYALKHTERIHLRSLRDMSICILPICIFQLLNGFFETTGMCFYPSGKASVILALIPLITTLLAIPFFHEKPSAGQFFFILLSFLGIFIVAGNSEDNFLFYRSTESRLKTAVPGQVPSDLPEQTLEYKTSAKILYGNAGTGL